MLHKVLAVTRNWMHLGLETRMPVALLPVVSLFIPDSRAWREVQG